MSITEEELQLREEARMALLKSAKALADKAPNHNPSSAAEVLRAAAAAYAIAAGAEQERTADAGGTF